MEVLNIQSEESILDLKTYTDTMIGKFKKAYVSYTVLNRKLDLIKSYDSVILNGFFNVKSKHKNIKMNFNTTVLNLYGEKIVVTIAYPENISKINQKKLLNIQKSFDFVGMKKKNDDKKLIKLNWYENKVNNYKLLIPSNYKLKKDSLFVNKQSSIIAIVLETSDLDLKDYFNTYIKKLKKKYKKLSILEENLERNNGFSILFVKISSDKQNITNIFYKKDENIYILTLSGQNKYIEKIKTSFQNL